MNCKYLVFWRVKRDGVLFVYIWGVKISLLLPTFVVIEPNLYVIAGYLQNMIKIISIQTTCINTQIRFSM